MLGVHDFWLFLLAGFLLNVTPGPDIAYIVARSAQCACAAVWLRRLE
jgi:threonine/homoserine/homoserine lactone efflux protein